MINANSMFALQKISAENCPPAVTYIKYKVRIPVIITRA